MSHLRIVHVAVAVIRDDAGRVLVAQRLPHQHLAGLWEFPGGKLEPGETLAEGMRREIQEELGITVESLAPLLRIEHVYPEKTVLLDVWRILRWSGVAPDAQGGIGPEGQPLRWLHPAEMNAVEFPPADVPIINALNLPPLYAISPDIAEPDAIAPFVDAIACAGVSLLQIRLKSRPELVRDVIAAIRLRLPQIRILINSDTVQAAAVLNEMDLQGADGLHLTAHGLCNIRTKPVPFCSVSCHNEDELAQAFALGMDFATLSPVQKTLSHPQAVPMGWQVFSQLVEKAGLPVYALGGLQPGDCDEACRHGAIGVAGISGFLA